MLNSYNNQKLGDKNSYKGTYRRSGLYIYRNENYNVQPLVILQDIVNTKGIHKGKLVSKYAVCLMKGGFLKLAKKGILNYGATITFDGFVCPLQSSSLDVAKIIWPKHIKQLNHLNYHRPVPLYNETIVGKIISNNQARYKDIPRKNKYVHNYQQWKKVVNIK